MYFGWVDEELRKKAKSGLASVSFYWSKAHPHLVAFKISVTPVSHGRIVTLSSMIESFFTIQLLAHPQPIEKYGSFLSAIEIIP